MFNFTDQFLEMIGNAGLLAYVILAIFLMLIAGSSIYGIRRAKEPAAKKQIVHNSATKLDVKRRLEQVIRGIEQGEIIKQEEVENVLGTGEYKCLCFRPPNILDFTTIPEPIGELYQIETSCPLSGSGYIVQEKDGKIVDYDPREVEVHIEQSPEYAWFATHWDILRTVFSVAVEWWKTPATWYAVGMMGIVFVFGLVVLD